MPEFLKVDQQVFNAHLVCVIFSIVVSIGTLIMFIIYHKLYKSEFNISYGVLVINLNS